MKNNETYLLDVIFANLSDANKRMTKLEHDVKTIKYRQSLQLNSVYGLFANEHLNNKWTPVSSRLPKKSGVYLVTKEYCGLPFVHIEHFSCGSWKDDSHTRVVAWMELPKPFEGDEEEV